MMDRLDGASFGAGFFHQPQHFDQPRLRPCRSRVCRSGWSARAAPRSPRPHCRRCRDTHRRVAANTAFPPAPGRPAAGWRERIVTNETRGRTRWHGQAPAAPRAAFHHHRSGSTWVARKASSASILLRSFSVASNSNATSRMFYQRSLAAAGHHTELLDACGASLLDRGSFRINGLSTTGSISLAVALVAGRNRVPGKATGRTALRKGLITTSSPVLPKSGWRSVGGSEHCRQGGNVAFAPPR